jgi:hypothetical protein
MFSLLFLLYLRMLELPEEFGVAVYKNPRAKAMSDRDLENALITLSSDDDVDE